MNNKLLKGIVMIGGAIFLVHLLNKSKQVPASKANERIVPVETQDSEYGSVFNGRSPMRDN